MTSPAEPPAAERFDGDDLTNEQIAALTQGIHDEAETQRPLISPTVPLSVLLDEYKSSVFLGKIEYLLAKGWNGLRRSCGDGNCFYRSVAFAYVERIMDAPDQSYAAATSLSTIEASLEDLKLVGFEPIVFEDFFDVLKELLVNIVQPDTNGQYMDHLSLLERFQDPYISNSVVVFLRLLTSAYIRLHPDDFAPFLFDPETFEPVEIVKFCETQVEASGREADHPQIQALTKALKVAVDIAYVDGSAGGAPAASGGGSEASVDFVRFETEGGSDGANPITLLYRPGHYDILERKPAVESEQFAR